MTARSPTLRGAVLTGLLVTLLWSSSWILIKHGLSDVPPLTFAGLRYSLAALMLLAVRAGRAGTTRRRISMRTMWTLCAFGLIQFTVTQGAQFVALAHLPAQTTSLALSTTPAVVAILSPLLLGERARPIQFLGIGLLLAGGALYLLPIAEIVGLSHIGVAALILAPLSNAAASMLGRRVNRTLAPIDVTAVSMVIGGATLLVAGLSMDGMPRLDAEAVGTIIWLATVNTAVAFTLWNRALKTLSATQASVINNTMLVQIAVLAWVFLGEPFTWAKSAGLALATLGAATAAR